MLTVIVYLLSNFLFHWFSFECILVVHFLHILVSFCWAFLNFEDCVSSTVWMHHLDSNETRKEKAVWKLYKYAPCWFKQIIKAAVRLLASHLTNYPSKNNKTHWTLINSSATFFYGFLNTVTLVLSDQKRFTYISSVLTQDAV